MSPGITVLVVLGGVALFLGVVEFITLRDKIQGNHITAAFHAFSETDLGKLVLMLVAYIAGAISGHIWNVW